MIDMLVLRCPIIKTYDIDLCNLGIPIPREFTSSTLTFAELEIPRECSLDADGNEIAITHRWECIPSSYSNMAFKLFDFRGDFSDDDRQDFFIEIKASPAKLMQGQNLYGTDDLWPCAEFMIHLLLDKYPRLYNYLDLRHWTVEQIDITYHSWARNEHEALQLVNALQNVSHGQTRARTGFSGTVYFGKANSRIKKIKVYVKLLEVQNQLKKLEKSGDKTNMLQHYSPELLEWAKGMVRWEASVKTRWMERRNISNNLFKLVKVFDAVAFWREATKDIFEALEGKEMRIIKDDNIEKQLREKFPTINARSGKVTYGQANSAYRVFRSIKSEGWQESKRTTGNGTFQRAIEMLHQCGLSKAVLQNLQGDGLKCEVIPFIRYVEIKFDQQIPTFAKLAS